MIVQLNMQSNYDVFTPEEWMIYEGFNEQICKVLQLNPMKLSDTIRRDFGYESCPSFPHMPEREGYEYVTYKQYAEELLNMSSYTHLFFLGQLDREIGNNVAEGILTMPRGTMVGLFNPWQGGGSLCEMELLRDMEIDLSKPHGESKYDDFVLQQADEQIYGYTVNDVYGMEAEDEFWNAEFKLK